MPATVWRWKCVQRGFTSSYSLDQPCVEVADIAVSLYSNYLLLFSCSCSLQYLLELSQLSSNPLYRIHLRALLLKEGEFRHLRKEGCFLQGLPSLPRWLEGSSWVMENDRISWALHRINPIQEGLATSVWTLLIFLITILQQFFILQGGEGYLREPYL